MDFPLLMKNLKASLQIENQTFKVILSVNQLPTGLNHRASRISSLPMVSLGDSKKRAKM
jgi:hypothetical protein